MFIRNAALAIAIGIPLLGCATQQRVSLEAGEGQQTITRDGESALISAKKNVVMIQPVSGSVSAGDRPAFVLLVGNMTRERLEFSPNMLSARVVAADNTSNSLKIFTYEELVQEENRRQMVGALAAGLAAAGRSMNAANAGYSNTYGNFGAVDSYGYRTSGTYSARTYDSYRAFSAQQLANAQTSADFASLRAAGEQNMARLQGTIIKGSTIFPGEMYGGQIVLQPVKRVKGQSSLYKIKLTLLTETHEFTIRQSDF
jgi:hypothetical protein